MRFSGLAFVATAVFVAVGISAQGESKDIIKSLLRKQYPAFDLLSAEGGNFTGSGLGEYLAFYQQPTIQAGKNLPEVWGAVFVVKDNRVSKVYDLRYRGLSTSAYLGIERYSKIVRNPELHFGRWAGYAYVGDFNADGLDEILFFEASGAGFFTYVYDFDGKGFASVLQAERNLSLIKTEDWGGHKTIKLYGYGGDSLPKGKRDWYRYEWDSDTKSYEVVEQGFE